MNALIIEDEKRSSDKLKKYLELLDPGISVIGVLGSIRDSVRFLDEHMDPDIIFLDIQLTDGESFKIFEKVKTDAYVIFITAYDQHALKAFDLKTVSYLLKPFDQSDVAKALRKYKNFKEKGAEGSQKERFLVRKGNRLYTFAVNDIAYFLKDKVLYLVSKSGEKFLIESTLDRLERSLSSSVFFRINRSCIIHYKSIESFVPDSSHRYRIRLRQNHQDELIVSQSRAADFRRWIQTYPS